MWKDSLNGLKWSKIFLLCAFAFCIYLFVIFKAETLPFSDFQYYYETALAILRGEGIKRDFLAMVKKLDLIDCLKWVPYIQYDRMPGVYSLMGASGGCLVTTSILEPFGMTAIEAMACECPVVASRVGGFREIIEEGQNGFLFEANHTEGAIGKMENLFEYPSERDRLTKNGRLTVETTYSSEKVVEKYLKVLKELAGGGPGDLVHRRNYCPMFGQEEGDVPLVGFPPEKEHHGSEALERARKRTQGSPSPC
jgi:hypothetical protein